MSGARELAKRILPDDALNWYRRQRVKRLYLDNLSRELLARQATLDDVEGRMAAKQNGFSEQVVKQVVERTEIILQELDRRIEGLQARTGQRLDGVERQLAELREEIGRLGSTGAGTADAGTADAGTADAGTADAGTAGGRDGARTAPAGDASGTAPAGDTGAPPVPPAL